MEEQGMFLAEQNCKLPLDHGWLVGVGVTKTRGAGEPEAAKGKESLLECLLLLAPNSFLHI